MEIIKIMEIMEVMEIIDIMIMGMDSGKVRLPLGREVRKIMVLVHSLEFTLQHSEQNKSSLLHEHKCISTCNSIL